MEMEPTETEPVTETETETKPGTETETEPEPATEEIETDKRAPETGKRAPETFAALGLGRSARGGNFGSPSGWESAQPRWGRRAG